MRLEETTCKTLKTLARMFGNFGDLGEREARHSGVARWPTATSDVSTGPAGRIVLATKSIGYRRKSVVEEQLIGMAIMVHDDGRIDIDGDELKLTLWNRS